MSYLPTDNLYKFCAIAGLIIIGFSLYYPWTLLRTLNADVIELSTDLGVLEAEGDFVKTRLHRLRLITQDPIKQKQGGDKHVLDTLGIAYSDLELKSMIDEIDRLVRDQQVATARTKGKEKKATILIDEGTNFFRLGTASFIVGSIITIYGFLSWYFKVQKPLDEKLKNAAFKEGAQADAAGDG